MMILTTSQKESVNRPLEVGRCGEGSPSSTPSGVFYGTGESGNPTRTGLGVVPRASVTLTCESGVTLTHTLVHSRSRPTGKVRGRVLVRGTSRTSTCSVQRSVTVSLEVTGLLPLYS